MGVTPLVLANGALHGSVARQPEPMHEPEPEPVMTTTQEEDAVSIRVTPKPVAQPAQSRPNGASDAKKIRITSIGSSLS